jgi:hypothetical protein
MTQHTSKRDHYDPFSDDVERCAVPVQGTLTIGTPKGISGPCPPEKIEPWDKVAVALARALDTFGDALSRCLVIKAHTSTIEAHISTYKAIVEAEKARASDYPDTTPDTTMSRHYWDYCLAKSVQECCKKPCDP